MKCTCVGNFVSYVQEKLFPFVCMFHIQNYTDFSYIWWCSRRCEESCAKCGGEM